MSELQHQLDAETIITARPFEELLELAVATCLNDPSLFERHLEELTRQSAENQNAKIVSRIGLWTVREALEESVGNFVSHYRTPEDDEIPPELIETRLDPTVQLKIQALGQSILDEAFLCLGDDAEEKVAEWQAAKNREEKLKVLNWQIRRVEAMVKEFSMVREASPEEAEEEEEDDDVEVEEDDVKRLYHPMRLAPKFIGKYPNMTADPTCLGVSILTAAFYEKAGIPYLHAGIMRTAADEVRQSYVSTAEIIFEYAKEHSIELPDDVDMLLRDIEATALKSLDHDAGFHAAVLARLDRRHWVQTDPNFDSNGILHKDTSQEITDTYKALHDLQPVARGVEVTWQNRRVLIPYYFTDFAEQLAKKIRPDSEIEEYLLNAPPGTTLKNLVQEFLGDFLKDSTISSYPNIRQQLEDMCAHVYKDKYKKTIEDDTFPRLMKQNLFPDAKDGDLSKSLERCKTDTRYLQRRVDDLKMMPLYALLTVQLDLGNHVIRGTYRRTHSTFEVGLPAYRIGASVLSDFAVWCGDELPPSFWLTYWPSHVSLGEHANKDVESPAQRELIAQTAEIIDNHRWTYRSVNGIVKSILEQKEGDAVG